MNSLIFNKNWKIDTDLHLRTHQFPKDPNTLILRTGLTYIAKPWLEVTGGYGYIEGYSFGEANGAYDPLFTEHRLWEQIAGKHSHLGFNFHHRLRAEQRFINGGVLLVNNTYQDRMRYRFHLSRPFIKSQPNLYGWGSYEHFWTLDDWKFDQGRLHAGLGYAFNKKLKIELGYLRHFVKNSMEFNRVQLNVFTTLQLKKPKG